MTIRSLKRQDGFTLIEVMVAALIILIAFTALAVVFIGGQNSAAGTIEESQLINAADQQVEQVRAAVDSGSFAALAMSAAPSVPSANASKTVENTWFDPGKFGYSFTASGTTSSCYEIDSNYDNINTSGSPPYGTQPSTFTPWSYCGTYGEPLEILPTGADITEGTGASVPACSSAGGAPNLPIASPCSVSLSPDNTVVYVYTIVTDTYVGCGTGAAGATTITTGGQTVTVPANADQQCPTVGSSGVSGCTVATAGTGTFGTTSTSSTACADARRLTIAVVPASTHTQLGRLSPVYLSTVITNPTPSASQSGSVGLTLQAAL